MKTINSKLSMVNFKLDQKMAVFGVFVVSFGAFAIFLPGFVQIDNLLSLSQNVSILGILALGMAMVVIGRGVDISIVAALAIPPGILLQLVNDGHSVSFAAGIALAIAVVFGLLNGWLIAYCEIPALFATLATGLFLAGFGQAFFFQLDVVQWNAQLDAFKWLGQGAVFGVPKPIIMFLIAAIIIDFILRKTVFGAFVYGLGSNPFTARAVGIPSRPLIVGQYLLSACIGFSAGLILAASLESMPTRIFNSSMVYDVILVVVLGGVSLSGGRGGVSNVIIGVLFIGTLLNGMTIMDLSYSAQNFFKGLILLLALSIDAIFDTRNEETAQQSDI